jgi:hypothetical protein
MVQLDWRGGGRPAGRATRHTQANAAAGERPPRSATHRLARAQREIRTMQSCSLLVKREPGLPITQVLKQFCAIWPMSARTWACCCCICTKPCDSVARRGAVRERTRTRRRGGLGGPPWAGCPQRKWESRWVGEPLVWACVWQSRRQAQHARAHTHTSLRAHAHAPGAQPPSLGPSAAAAPSRWRLLMALALAGGSRHGRAADEEQDLVL